MAQILGGFLFAGLQTIGTVLLPFASAYKDVFAFSVVIAIMVLRPTGLIQEKLASGCEAMPGEADKAPAGFWPGIVALALANTYVIALLAVEKQHLIISLLASGIVVVLVAAWFGIFDSVSRSFTEHEKCDGWVRHRCAGLPLVAFFHEDHFVLLLVITVLLYSVATLGLNISLDMPAYSILLELLFLASRLYRRY